MSLFMWTSTSVRTLTIWGLAQEFQLGHLLHRDALYLQETLFLPRKSLLENVLISQKPFTFP